MNGNEVQKKKRKKRPIERDDFPAPPFPYSRRRHWSEPLKSSSSEDEDDEPVETVHVSSSEEEEVADPKLDQTETELKKISTGMANVFLQDLAVERLRRKTARSTKFIDPRSAARTPAANREPAFRLRSVLIMLFLLGSTLVRFLGNRFLHRILTIPGMTAPSMPLLPASPTTYALGKMTSTVTCLVVLAFRPLHFCHPLRVWLEVAFPQPLPRDVNLRLCLRGQVRPTQ